MNEISYRIYRLSYYRVVVTSFVSSHKVNNDVHIFYILQFQ